MSAAVHLGSVLDALFPMYINDLVEIINRDDTSLFSVVQNVARSANDMTVS